MTKSNRVLNRIILVVLGLVAIVVGLVAAALWTPAVTDMVTMPSARSIDLGPTTLWIVAVVCAVLVVLALCWILTRGRGGTAIALRERADDDEVTVNVGLVRDVVEQDMAAVRDVVGTRVDMTSVRGDRVARIRLQVRRGGDAVAVLEAVDASLASLDATLGREIPAVVHLTGGIRSATTSATRVA